MEATSTLADALLDDLDDLSDYNADQDVNIDSTSDAHHHDDGALYDPNDNSYDHNDDTIHRKCTNILDHPEFMMHMETIITFVPGASMHASTATGSASATTNLPHSTQTPSPDHSKLLSRTNQYLMMIQQEMEVYHDKVVDIYQYKFPQLDTMITNISQYLQVVQILDNQTDITTKSVQDQLNLYLTNQQIITISIAYSTCNGRTLNPEEYQQLHQHVRYMTQVLLHYQTICLQYVEQQMIHTVPNMVAFLNSSALTAQLLSQVPHGSIEHLTKIPACNLQLIGSSSSRSSSSMSISGKNHRTTTAANILSPQHAAPNVVKQPLAHAGILLQSDLVQSVPRALQMTVLKIVASKLALAIRCDYNRYLYHANSKNTTDTNTSSNPMATIHNNNNSYCNDQQNGTNDKNPNGNEGYMFRQQVQKKIQQLLEPTKAPTLKALPKPDLTVKKRRGGQRMRRLKGRYEETALMKQANTRAFSIQTGEYGDDAMGRTLGLLEMSTGSVGASATTEHSSIRSKNNIEQKKMKYANTRASRKKAAQMNRQGLAVASSSLDSNNANRSNGMASSMVFTPVQGMELVNPDAMKDRVKEANRKWFSTNAGFQSAVPPKK